MKKVLSNKTLQVTFGRDAKGGFVVRGRLGAFLYTRLNLRPLIRTSRGKGIVAPQDAVIFPGTTIQQFGQLRKKDARAPEKPRLSL